MVGAAMRARSCLLLTVLPATLAACGGAEPPPPSPPPPASASAPPPAPPPSAAPSASAVASVEPAPPPPPPEPPPIPKGTKVLHFGDSFVDAGFWQALKPKLTELGAKYEVKFEKATYTVSWAGKVPGMMKQYEPDLVIVNIGGNEIANTDPKTHAHAVKRIVEGFAGRPCVWVSPPMWKKDTGIINVMRTNAAPCRFFDTGEHVKEKLPRRGDKIHPNKEGGQIWADAFWKWLHKERAPADPKVTNVWTLKPGGKSEYEERATIINP